MRIKGLVAVSASIRNKLSQGLPASDVERFKDTITTNVAIVEKICRDHHIQPAQLPAPSYRAYLFLKSVDLNHLPARDTEAVPPAPTVRITRISKIAFAIHAELDRISQEQPPPSTYAVCAPVVRVMQKITTDMAQFDAICQKLGIDASQLPTKSRNHYQWLCYLSDSDNMNVHMTTIAAFRKILAEPNWVEHPLLASRSFDIELYVLPKAYHIRIDRKRITLMLSEGFVNAPREAIEAFLHLMVAPPNKKAKTILSTYISGDDFIETLSAIELIAAPSEESMRGRHYDLAEAFTRVNMAYFNGSVPRPHLTWNRTLTVRKMGHYRYDTDTVMISTALDDPRVPAYAFDFVMYHELLHMQLGVQMVNGRRYAHTDAFRKAERRFAQYEIAKQFMETMQTTL